MAQAILLKDVDKLGESGDVIDVAPGYLRNFLVPRKLAAAGHTGFHCGLRAAPRRRREGCRGRGGQGRRDGGAIAQDRADDLASGR